LYGGKAREPFWKEDWACSGTAFLKLESEVASEIFSFHLARVNETNLVSSRPSPPVPVPSIFEFLRLAVLPLDPGMP
jgi:hypothetical protein